MAASWSYDGEEYGVDEWVDLYPECGYERQSPIDLVIDDEISCETEPLLLDWTSTATDFAIHNNGHSLQAIPFEISSKGGSDVSGLEIMRHTNDTSVRLRNSFFNTYQSEVHQSYCFDSLHFHWSEDNEHGSEHTVNGQSFPLEVHLVHYSCDYKVAGVHWSEDNEHGSEHTVNGQSFPLEVHLVHYSCDYKVAGAALKEYSSGLADYKYDDDNVLAVIGVLFEIGEANPAIDAMVHDMIVSGIEKHEEHSYHDDHVHDVLRFYYTQLDLQSLLPESREMVAYQGSLTTPPCYQTVRWHVMKDRMTVSVEQMEKFRTLLMTENRNDTISPNYRPVQPLHGRKVYYCNEDVTAETVAKDSTTSSDKADDGLSLVDWQILAACGFGLFFVTAIACCIAHRQQVKRLTENDTERKLSTHVEDFGTV
eukprot:CAMPEP_0202726832 /NCGR_PEP_ID=MMETSP1385-20130828/184814_1 /ASSEMBLY_ACC=CAM_ASM_000861 /TAXON_ID=933848 /ORGANISM="Elphidium margaritaceum" /LENGTH=422 /DNA_ID=CAMNT_0049393061 /DNA_START=116 /DNA_END=1384 /DNA_ORIENTATION=-